MDIPIEQITDKLLTNRLISRKAVIVAMGLGTLAYIAKVLFTPPKGENLLVSAPLDTTEIILSCILIAGVIAVSLAGVIVQGQIDKQNGNGTKLPEIPGTP